MKEMKRIRTLIEQYLYKVILLFILCFSYTTTVHCQTIDFINYSEAQVMYNPAMLSSIQQTQAVINYRNNRITNDVTDFSSMLGVQVPLGLYFEKLNLGTVCISAFDDHSNYAPSVKSTGIVLAYSQPVQLSGHSFVSIGLQCNVYQKKLDISAFTTGSQWDANLGFDPSLTNGETQFANRLNQYSLNSGIYWQLNANDKRKAYAGVSLYNINRPNENFTGNGIRQPWWYFINGGYTFVDNSFGNIAIDALCDVRQKQTTAGAGIKAGIYYGTNSSGVGEIAAFSRYLSSNTLVAGAMFEQQWFTFGISYDFSTSQSFNSDSRSNAFELFLKVRFGRTVKKKNTATVAPANYHPGQKRVFAEERRTEVIESSTPDAQALKKVEAVSDTSNAKYEPIKLALRRDFKFAFNDATLSAEAKSYLDELVALMNKNKNVTMEIVCHTDDVASKEGNLKISLLRAQIEADYLVSKGIDKKRLTVTWKIDSEPLFPNTTPENRARNRRVEFIIMN